MLYIALVRGLIINRTLNLLAALLLLLAFSGPIRAQDGDPPDPQLNALADEFRAWLAVNSPVTPFAADRLQRPGDWAPDWSRTSLQRRKTEYLQFQGRLKAVNTLGYDVANRIDAAMLGAALERVHWQLEVLASPRRDPGFYLDQALGSVFEVLVRSPQPGGDDLQAIILRLKRFTGVVNAAKLNLDRTVPALAEAALVRIGDVDARVDALQAALGPSVPEGMQDDFALGIRAASQSLASYKNWLSVSLERFVEPPAIGVQRYRWYLSHVAQVPSSTEALRAQADQVLAQAGAELAVARHRHPGQQGSTSLDSVERVVQMATISGREVVTFLESAALVEMPEDLPLFELGAMPAVLAALAGVSEAVLFGASESQTAGRYLHASRDAGGYMEQLAWEDPRLLLTWDALPGRHTQFRMAARNPRPIRRHATGPSLSEGLATYFHRQIAEAGLYSFSPGSDQLALEMLRYRAALARIDVMLASGALSVGEAVEELAGTVNVPRALAARDVQNLVAHPGVAGAVFAAYGQVISYLSDAFGTGGGDFSLTEFNTRLLRNAHVPVAFQRWESLGLEDELDQLVEQRGRPATVPE